MSQNDLLQASRDGDEKQVRLLLQNGADIHTRNEDRQTSLMLAAKTRPQRRSTAAVEVRSRYRRI
jgi:ankyrin repeat protein